MSILLTRLRWIALLGAAMLALPLAAQEGFPLDGTWRGAWADDDDETLVVMVMKWNGEIIQGTINPGPRSIAINSATLDPASWTLRVQAESADGEAILIEGRLSDIGAYNRRIDGNWTQAGVEHSFWIVRE